MHQYPLIQCKIFLLLIYAHLVFNMLNNLELLQLAGIIRMQQLNLVPGIDKKVLFYQRLAVVWIKHFELDFLVIHNWVPNFHEEHIIVFVNYSRLTSVAFNVENGHDCLSSIDHHKVDFAFITFEAQMLNLLSLLIETSIQLLRKIWKLVNLKWLLFWEIVLVLLCNYILWI